MRRDRHPGGRPPQSQRVQVLARRQHSLDHRALARILLSIATIRAEQARQREATTPTDQATSQAGGRS